MPAPLRNRHSGRDYRHQTHFPVHHSFDRIADPCYKYYCLNNRYHSPGYCVNFVLADSYFQNFDLIDDDQTEQKYKLQDPLKIRM